MLLCQSLAKTQKSSLKMATLFLKTLYHLFARTTCRHSTFFELLSILSSSRPDYSRVTPVPKSIPIRYLNDNPASNLLYNCSRVLLHYLNGEGNPLEIINTYEIYSTDRIALARLAFGTSCALADNLFVSTFRGNR